MQVKTQLSQEDGQRLDKIIHDFRFKSRFELAKALIRVFIKLSDPREDEIVPENFRDILDQEVDTQINNNQK